MNTIFERAGGRLLRKNSQRNVEKKIETNMKPRALTPYSNNSLRVTSTNSIGIPKYER
jgi:hypothetical protein